MVGRRLFLAVLVAQYVCVVYALRINELYKELFPAPTYDVSFSNTSISKTDALLLLQNETPREVLANETAVQWRPDTDYELYRVSASEAYLCRHPSAQEKEDIAQQLLPRARTPNETQAILADGLSVLREKQGGCLTSALGYFVVEFCYGKRIRQFPAEEYVKELQGISRGSAPSKDTYLLGAWRGDMDPLPPMHATASDVPSTSTLHSFKETGASGALPDALPANEPVYIAQTWQDGTLCDLNDMPRQTEVRVRVLCLPSMHVGRLTTSTSTRLPRYGRVTSTCSQLTSQLSVHVPELCFLPAFESSDREPVHMIECRMVTPDDAEERENHKKRVHRHRHRHVNTTEASVAPDTLDLAVEDTEPSEEPHVGPQVTGEHALESALLDILSQLRARTNKKRDETDNLVTDEARSVLQAFVGEKTATTTTSSAAAATSHTDL